MIDFYTEKLLDFIKEDVYPEDITSRIVKGIKARGYIRSKDSGILAGNGLLPKFLSIVGIRIISKKDDGKEVRPGDELLVIEGDADDLLGVERVILNILGKLSGIATATHLMVNKAREVNSSVRIAGTRKTTPGLRLFEKYAIEVGGGDPHRFNLSDAILIKDNHIALIGSVTESIKLARKIASFTKKLEIEVNSVEDAILAYKAGVDAILLDNMKPREIEEVVKELKGKLIIEASGRINPDNVVDYARTGVDIISSGYITHSSRSLDFSMDIERI
ncbi:carboxylating nicotinate-nucleotide diphosphorylase [Acidianus sp. RZ1]|uniref:carboxylating nicotinate-nucleotide diphosphorylase n=1 Tax=Acidianus sp. RZ1 TaxID=1540082 RepID=UPI0014918CB4|nr:carboxylating nicotinate-nucleotide diphosphorylase [Acidianus sp. RZ1]NON62506.1 carboxylating nicotinate-nucleotide diphosphorylase [Acidianus sp. RZ1]